MDTMTDDQIAQLIYFISYNFIQYQHDNIVYKFRPHITLNRFNNWMYAPAGIIGLFRFMRENYYQNNEVPLAKYIPRTPLGLSGGKSEYSLWEVHEAYQQYEQYKREQL